MVDATVAPIGTVAPAERLQRLAERLLDKADESVRVGDWQRVKELAEEALLADPANSDAPAFREIAERRLLSELAPAHESSGLPKGATPLPNYPQAQEIDSTLHAREALGGRLRAARQMLGLRQTDVAVTAGITQAALSNYERGKRELPLSTLLSLAASLDVGVAELLELPEMHGYMEREMAGMGTSRYDARNQEREWSPGVYRLLGLEPGSIEPGPEAFLEFVHPDDRERGATWFRDLLAGEPRGAYELRIIRADGSLRYIEGYASVQVDEDGDSLGFVATMRDVTERALRERSARETTEHLARAQDVARIVSWEIDVATRVLRGTAQMAGLPSAAPGVPRQISPDEFLARVHADDRAEVERFRERAYEGELMFPSHQFRVVDPDGAIRVLRTVAEVIHDSSGRPTKVLGTTQDITQLEEIRDSFVAAQAVVEWLGEHAHVPWYALDAQFRVVSVGRQLAGLTDRPQSDLLGASAEDLYVDVPRHPQPRYPGTPVEESCELRSASGKPIPVRLHAFHLGTADPRGAAVLCLLIQQGDLEDG